MAEGEEGKVSPLPFEAGDFHFHSKKNKTKKAPAGEFKLW